MLVEDCVLYTCGAALAVAVDLVTQISLERVTQCDPKLSHSPGCGVGECACIQVQALAGEEGGSAGGPEGVPGAERRPQRAALLLPVHPRRGHQLAEAQDYHLPPLPAP